MSTLTPDLCGPTKPIFLNADGSFAFLFPSILSHYSYEVVKEEEDDNNEGFEWHWDSINQTTKNIDAPIEASTTAALPPDELNLHTGFLQQLLPLEKLYPHGLIHWIKTDYLVLNGIAESIV